MKFKIGKRIISTKSKPLIVAEIGINHFGSLKFAKKIVDKIKKTGAEAIKVQIHIPDEEMSEECKNIKPGNSNKSIYEVIKQNSLSLDEELKLKNYIKKKKLIYIATPFSFKAAKWLGENNVDIFKIGSGECNNLPLVEYVASFKKPMIVSTGMNSLKSVKNTHKLLKKNKINHVLMHCVNLYPTNYNLVRFQRLKKMLNQFKNSLIGYSDHTVGIDVCKVAISLGAVVIEKHFTYNKKNRGPDISSSMDYDDLKKLLKFTEIFVETFKNNEEIIKDEDITRKFAFHSVVTKTEIKKGCSLNKENLTVKRPGIGDFHANKLKNLFGKKAKKNLKANTLLKRNDIF